jgi:hypothetical protein
MFLYNIYHKDKENKNPDQILTTTIENSLKDIKEIQPSPEIQYPKKISQLNQDYETLNGIILDSPLNDDQIDVLKRNMIFSSDTDSLDQEKMKKIDALILKMRNILNQVTHQLKQKIYLNNVIKDEQIQNERYTTMIKDLEFEQKNINEYINIIKKRIEENKDSIKNNDNAIKQVDSIIKSIHFGGHIYKRLYLANKKKYLVQKKKINVIT